MTALKPARLEDLLATMTADIAAHEYDGGVLLVARSGQRGAPAAASRRRGAYRS